MATTGETTMNEQLYTTDTAVDRLTREVAAAVEVGGRFTRAEFSIDDVATILEAAVQQPNRDALVDVIADRIGEHPQAFNVFDITDEATTLIKEAGVEELAEFIADAVLAALAVSATGEVEWEYGEFPADELLDDGTIHEWAEPKDVWENPLADFELAELRNEGGIYARRVKAGKWEVTP